MHGYVMAWADCLICGRVFGCNPDRVPSIRRTPDSPREPICEHCMIEGNAERERRGLVPHPILPGAYDWAPEFPDDDY